MRDNQYIFVVTFLIIIFLIYKINFRAHFLFILNEHVVAYPIAFDVFT